MRKSTLVGGLAAALASMVLVLPPPASAQTGGGSGDVYADLFIALRDVDGVPILSKTFWEGVVPDAVPVTCIQPISSVPVSGIDPMINQVVNPADGRVVYLVPLVGEGSSESNPVEADAACDPLVPNTATEVDLERLNLVRTDERVLWKKLVDIGTRLNDADEITLDGAGRITTWTEDVATAIDASPDHAAIYSANEGKDPAPPPDVDGKPGAGQPGGLMDTGTIPHWTPEDVEDGEPAYPIGDPAFIQQGTDPITGDPTPGFDNWDLAATAIGSATGKSVPVTIDTIQYYNRIASRGVDNWDYVSKLPPPVNEEDGLTVLTDVGFVDYSKFSYTRSEVFQGCTTWLDVPTLRWKFDDILDRVEFGALPPVASGDTVKNVAGFAQLADDVRSVINYLHNNEVVVNPDTGEGFFIDPVFTESCEAQALMVQKLNTAVDPSPPTVTITAAPEAVTTATDARFEFTANADAASVLCVLDGGAIELCKSPKTYTGLELGEHTFTVIAGSTAGNYVSDTHTWTIVRPGEDLMITPLTPVRFADTRAGWIAADRLFVGTGPVPAGGVVQVQIAGRGAVPVGAKAVVANVTLVGAAAPGFATVFPCGTVPNTSSVNYLAVTNEAVANEVIARLSSTGSICVFTSAAANVLVDVAGYVPATSDFVSLTPVRLADTRPTPVAAGKFVEVQIAGRGGVPADAKAVVANVTLVGAAAPGFATGFPCGTVPDTSSANYLGVTNEAVANEVIAKLSPTGSICVFTSAAANVLVDVAGHL